MGDDPEPAEDERAVELSTISAIFPELVISPDRPFHASLEIAVAPAKAFPVVFPALSSSEPPNVLPAQIRPDVCEDGIEAKMSQTTASEVRYLSYLPPLRLEITLPDAYPSTLPPQVQLSSQSEWLPVQKLNELQGHARVLWENAGRNPVVYDYIDFLQQSAESGFGLAASDGTALEVGQHLEIKLLDYDSKMHRENFEKQTFDCGICLEPKKGAVCHRLVRCGHVFCVECLQDFYNNCITQGDVGGVKCLAPDCEKENGRQQRSRSKRRRRADPILDPSELLQIPLEQEQVQRYVKFKRKKELESDKSTIYCPRQWCQGAAKSSSRKAAEKEEEEEEEEVDRNDSGSETEGKTTATTESRVTHETLPPPSERLAICEDCHFAFCVVCKSSWHGEFAQCFPRRQYELTAEERATEVYLRKHSTPCPTCNARCQKTMGCNHMICFKCNTHFCYLCSAWLDGDNPYSHFNTQWKPCYQRLWELEEGDEDHGNVPNAPAAPAAPPPPEVIFEESDEELPPPAPEPPGERRRAPRPRGAQGNLRQQQPGLQRFLRMAAEDREDEWDSDELDSDEDDARWEIPIRGGR